MSRREIILLLAILTLALALRLYRLDAQSLWNDEGTSVALAQRDLATITRNAAHDIHPPLYYYLLHFWIGLTGTSEWAVRSLSVLCGVLLVAGVYALGRRLDRPQVAGLGAFLAALSPFQVYYAQETRMYILVALFGLLATLAFVCLLGRWAAGSQRGARLVALAYILASILAIYSHYLAFTLLLAQNIAFFAWLIGKRPGFGRVFPFWVTTQAIIVASYVPWLILSWSSLHNWPAVVAPFSLADLVGSAAQVLPLGITVSAGIRIQLLGISLSLLVLPGIFLRGRTPIDGEDSTRIGWNNLLLALYLVAPLVVMYGLSLQRPMYKPKFLLLAMPAYDLLIAGGVVALGRGAQRLSGRAWPRYAVIVALTLGVALASVYSLINLYGNPSYRRDDYRGIVAHINATAGPQDAILINAPAQVETVDYYYHGPLPEYPLPAQRPIDTIKTEAALNDLIARHPRIYAILWATDESDPQRFIESWLDARCFKALDSWFGNVRLAVYAVPQQAAHDIAHPADDTVGESVRFRGYTLLTPELHSGDIAQLTLFWEATAPIAERYKVFVHLLDARGNIVGQRDSEPGGGLRLTTDWQPGEIIADNYGLLIPPGSPPGEHTLRVGLYGLNDGQRLPIRRGNRDLGDALDVARLTVQPAIAPPPMAALDAQQTDRACWEGLCLAGHSLHRLGFEHLSTLELRPGDVARLTLFWRREGHGTAREGFRVALVGRGGRRAWEGSLSVAGGAFPLAAWREGEIVRDIHRLTLPPDLLPGAYDLVLQPEGWGDGRTHRLERVMIR